MDPGQHARVVSVALGLTALWLMLKAVARWQTGGTIQAGLHAAGAVLAVVVSVATWRTKRW